MKKLFYLVTLVCMCITNTLLAQNTNYEVRAASHPDDVKHYDTETLRKHFAVDTIFTADKVNMVYSMYDRFIVGGAMPVYKSLPLEAIDPLKAPNFLHKREIGIINVGEVGYVVVDDKTYTLKNKEAIYVGSGKHEVTFKSKNPLKPALFYFNSCTAHKSFPTKLVKQEDAKIINAGSLEGSNKRAIRKLIVHENVETCQLQLGMTELAPGSVWNTMPAHLHGRRMEAYFYFDVPDNQQVCHFMGEPQETRHIWIKNNQAVISPEWSIHCGTGTANYVFIWGMAGENLDYSDKEVIKTSDLK